MDELLIEKAQRGDKECFAAAVMEIKDKAYRIAYCYLHNSEDSMDAVCDGVEKAFRNIKKLRDARFFSTWFIKIVINECNRRLRKQGREVALDERIGTGTGGMRSDDCIDLELLMSRLHHRDRALIYMKYYMGYTLDEISYMMGIPPGTVRSRIYNNLRDMKCKLMAEEVQL